MSQWLPNLHASSNCAELYIHTHGMLNCWNLKKLRGSGQCQLPGFDTTLMQDITIERNWMKA